MCKCIFAIFSDYIKHSVTSCLQLFRIYIYTYIYILQKEMIAIANSYNSSEITSAAVYFPCSLEQSFATRTLTKYYKPLTSQWFVNLHSLRLIFHWYVGTQYALFIHDHVSFLLTQVWTILHFIFVFFFGCSLHLRNPVVQIWTPCFFARTWVHNFEVIWTPFSEWEKIKKRFQNLF